VSSVSPMREPSCVECGHMLTQHHDWHWSSGRKNAVLLPPSCKDCSCSYDWYESPMAWALFSDREEHLARVAEWKEGKR
jgi:hypothetical protein